MLMEVKDYLASRREASVRDVAAHFSISQETARALLEHWVRKGKASRLSLEQCRQCALHCGKSWEAYQWLEQKAEYPR
ncbi:MAG: DeoR family transcriptional regulator [Alphaproteobacteria bacterium]|nr:DeoR family transcriptional regulator [Alphaproteobacteria bacterium]MBM3651887.1 DeoR family transcriptional regulator [Alphaproteobacteria bacterium]